MCVCLCLCLWTIINKTFCVILKWVELLLPNLFAQAFWHLNTQHTRKKKQKLQLCCTIQNDDANWQQVANIIIVRYRLEKKNNNKSYKKKQGKKTV